jgi:quercetin dioxygenase-like cupin family protein
MRFAKSRRRFNRDALLSVLAGFAATSIGGTAFAQTSPAAGTSARRAIIKQALPGDPGKELTLVEITYPPGTGSPPHLHLNGVMAFVVSGSIVSQVGAASEQTYHAGEAWWEPPGAVHRISRNASATEPAILLAIYIAPKDAAPADLMKPL